MTGTDFFNVTIGEQTYNPNNIADTVESEIQCPSGTVRLDALCGKFNSKL